jgi:hypothetical protein
MCAKPVLSLLLIAASCGFGCARDPSIPLTREEGNRLLFEAVKGNRLNDIRELIGRGADPNALIRYTDGGETPLTVASVAGDVEAVQALLESGASVDGRDTGVFYGRTPLMLAVATNKFKVVDVLLHHGANPNWRPGLFGTEPTALYLAADRGFVECVTLLLAHGAFVTRKDLEAAIRGGHTEVVTRLLQAGADPWWRVSQTVTIEDLARQSPMRTRAEMIKLIQIAKGIGVIKG